MKRALLFLILALIAAVGPAAAEEAAGNAQQPVDVARRYVDAFLAGDMQTLLDHASPPLKKLMKNAATVAALRDQSVGNGAQSADEEISVSLTRRVKSAGGQAFAIMAQVAPDGQLVAFSIQPAGEAPSKPLKDQAKKAADDGQQPDDVARRYVDAFLAGDMQTLLDHASPPLKQLMKDAATIAALRDQSVGDGAQSANEEISVSLTRRVKSAAGQAFAIMAQVAPDGQLVAFSIQPADEAPSEFLDYRTKAELRLPFDGTWTVVWGGRTIKQNYHVISTGQRFAYDILQLRDGTSHAGDGRKNEDYYCFGQPILAPGAGRVVTAVDGIADNIPGQMNPTEPCGNHVVLDLGSDEFLFLAHLQKGSVKVKPGDRATAGQALGLCGNSGNSSEPHLHIHLQTTPHLADGKGLPLQFQRYQADGQPVDRGEPTKDQQIALAPGQEVTPDPGAAQVAPRKAEKASGPPDPSLQKSPFAAVRWQQSQPEVQIGEEWFKLVSLDGLPASEIVAFSRRTYRDRWRMRFEEDLVDLLTRMGHPPQDKVTLVVQSLTSPQTQTLEDVAMTHANRTAIKAATLLRERSGQEQPTRADAAIDAPAEAPAKVEKAVDVSAEALQKLVGSYELAPGLLISVEALQGKLMIGLAGQPPQQVFARSETVWFYKGVDATFTFKVGKNGKCDSLVLSQKQTAKRK